jgi:hypothetical protein
VQWFADYKCENYDPAHGKNMVRGNSIVTDTQRCSC